MRIVSMLPSATEIVYALGRDDDLVGVTFECNEPPRAGLEKPIVVGAPRGRHPAAQTRSTVGARPHPLRARRPARRSPRTSRAALGRCLSGRAGATPPRHRPRVPRTTIR